MSLFKKKKVYFLLCFNYLTATKHGEQGVFFALHLDKPITRLVPGEQVKGRVIRSTTKDGKLRIEAEGEDYHFWPERMYNIGLYETAQEMVQNRFTDLL